jgi:hypothetical protein
MMLLATSPSTRGQMDTVDDMAWALLSGDDKYPAGEEPGVTSEGGKVAEV